MELYRAARALPAEQFPEHVLAWLCRRIPFDQGFFVTSSTRATWVDAHFYKVPDPRTLMASHAAIEHVDAASARMLTHPFEVQYVSYEDEWMAAPRFAPLRDHLVRFDAKHTLMVAIPWIEGTHQTSMVLVRGKGSRPFSKRCVKLFEALAPHAGEAVHVNRTWFLPRNQGLRADCATALMSSDGMLKAVSAEFAGLVWPDDPARSAYLPEPLFRELRRGRAFPLSSGKHTLYAEPTEAGWLLLVRKSGPADQLSQREREIAAGFARGESHRAIAARLGLSPVTVRNHLQNIYSKLDVSTRDELRALVGPA